MENNNNRYHILPSLIIDQLDTKLDKHLLPTLSLITKEMRNKIYFNLYKYYDIIEFDRYVAWEDAYSTIMKWEKEYVLENQKN
jgi:hypothetical protein